MNIRRTGLNWMIGTCVMPVIYGLGGFASQVDAQPVASRVMTRSAANEASTSQGADLQDAELKQRVSAALDAQPYLYDRHIDISVRGGVVVLSGIVFSDWDLGDALRIARKAAGARPVIDSLSIEREGRIR
jgi:osmotically-inducible protein OsmY